MAMYRSRLRNAIDQTLAVTATPTDEKFNKALDQLATSSMVTKAAVLLTMLVNTSPNKSLWVRQKNEYYNDWCNSAVAIFFIIIFITIDIYIYLSRCSYHIWTMGLGEWIA